MANLINILLLTTAYFELEMPLCEYTFALFIDILCMCVCMYTYTHTYTYYTVSSCISDATHFVFTSK